VFAIGELRALWAAQVLSAAGDRLALVALALLVYGRTRSPLLAAVAYAAGTIPYMAGGLLLGWAADRFPRRDVMVICDVSRAVLVTAMLLPHMPVWALVALLYLVTTIQPAFEAARASVLVDMVDRERYPLVIATFQTSLKVSVIAGAAAAGVLVALIGARPLLGADAATFAVSALLLRFGTRARPAASRAPASGRPARRYTAGARLVFADPALRTLLLFGWMGGLYAVPAGIAGPYAASIGVGPAAVGLLIASTQAGAALVAPVLTRTVSPQARQRWMGPMAVCACATLILTIFHPALAASIVIFAVSGSFGTYQVAANAAFAARLPDERRAQAWALAAAGVVGGQGIVFTVAGALSSALGPSVVITVSGALGMLTACALTRSWMAQTSPGASVARAGDPGEVPR
jgi:predicted MFS family arabinose efflux permease